MAFFAVIFIIYVIFKTFNGIPSVESTNSINKNRYYIDQFGYYRFKNSGKLVHRYIAGKTLGRRLYNSEVVHHIDRNKRNNRPENLYVCSPDEHHVIHAHSRNTCGRW